MKVDGKATRTIWLEPDGWSVGVIDQTALPHRYVTTRLTSLAEAEQADFVTADTRLVGEVQATSWEQRTVSLSQYDLSDG